jgi:hypothetical protein
MRFLPLPVILVAGALPAASAPLAAQQQAAPQMILASYFECDVTREATADAMMQRMAPVFQRMVSAGAIQAYGYSAHVIGGQWRRFLTFTGERDKLLVLWSSLAPELQKEVPDAFAEFNRTCGSHQDYLWAMGPASPGAATTALQQGDQYRLTTYFFCNMNREGQADEVVEKALGPEIQKHVGMGHLASWAWVRHVAGGNVRRLLTLTGSSVPVLFQMQQAVVGALTDQQRTQFTEACGGHFDYVWRTVPLGG